MADEGFKRKLTAILSADVKGYSRLMAEDETATVKTLETYREVMSTLIKQHRGRVVDSPGDNLLAEFTSVVDAVQCALAAQKEFQARNAELPENRRMQVAPLLLHEQHVDESGAYRVAIRLRHFFSQVTYRLEYTVHFSVSNMPEGCPAPGKRRTSYLRSRVARVRRDLDGPVRDLVQPSYGCPNGRILRLSQKQDIS